MLFFATSINYMDRQVIALLKPTLQHTIGLTELNYGYIVDAFQAAYAIGLLVAGRLVDKIGTRIGYILIMGVWSLSAMGHALANTALEFGIARFCLGIGESGNFPAAIKTIAEWFPQNERSLATGIFNSGANVGRHSRAAHRALGNDPFRMARRLSHHRYLQRALDPLVVEELPQAHRSSHAYWRGAAPHLQGSRDTDGAIDPWIRLLGYRQTWAFSVAKFLTDPIWWFYLFWLPSYFSARFHLDLSHLGLPLILIYNMSAVGSIGGGWLPAPFRKLGFSAAGARLAAMCFCACLVVPVFTIGHLNSEWAAIALLGVAAGAHQGWSANLFTTVSDMFPRTAVGSVTGIGSMAGSVGGFLIAFYAGHILQRTHSYSSLFVLASTVYLLALALVILLAPKLRKAEFAA